MRIRANVGQQPTGDEDSAELQRFRRAVLGLGRIGPPYLDKRYATSYQQWRALSFEECQAVVAMLWRWLGSVKREEARAAFRPYLSQFAWRKTRRPRAKPYADWALSAFNTGSLEAELAWAAGLFDGEGWVGVRERPGATGKVLRHLRMHITQCGDDGVPDVLTRFRAAVGGLGWFEGPQSGKNFTNSYKWAAIGRPAVAVLESILPALAQTKRAEACAALERVRVRSQQ